MAVNAICQPVRIGSRVTWEIRRWVSCEGLSRPGLALGMSSRDSLEQVSVGVGRTLLLMGRARCMSSLRVSAGQE